jgi:hypothetical protein
MQNTLSLALYLVALFSRAARRTPFIIADRNYAIQEEISQGLNLSIKTSVLRLLILDSDYVFIRQLNTDGICLVIRTGGNSLNQNIVLKCRDELEAKMATVLGEEIRELSTEYQQILIDDMVTAFENRLKVLNRPKIGSVFDDE